MRRTDDKHDPVVHHRTAGQCRVDHRRLRADRDVDSAGQQQRVELFRVAHAELHVEIRRPLGEQLDQAGRRVLGEQARRRHPQQPAPATGRADLEDGAVLQPEQLRGAARQAQPARCEGKARRGPGEELVAQLAAELADVQRDRRLGDLELGGGLLDGPESHDGRVRPQLRGRHARALMPVNLTPSAPGRAPPIDPHKGRKQCRLGGIGRTGLRR
nr:hypothetical protein GCM10020092_042970 [Actinoplanes digitatis]